MREAYATCRTRCARLEPWAAATNRGYSPPGRERLNARRKTREPKEAFNVKGAGNQYDAAPALFGTVADELWRVLVVKAAKRYADAAALALKRDAERAKKLALRENKKLAKEVTQWVETAQGKFQENGGDETQCAQQ